MKTAISKTIEVLNPRPGKLTNTLQLNEAKNEDRTEKDNQATVT